MIRLALLVCDTPIPTVVETHGTYIDIYRTLLQSSRPAHPFELDGYDVVQQKYPTDEKLAQYDGIIISGSSVSAYAEVAWIPPLLDFIAKVTTGSPLIKIVGICFGQQVIARALGGECVPNMEGWEVGVYPVDLTPVGRLIFGPDQLRIQQMHRDHVPALPPNFQLLGSTPKCLVHGMVLPYGSKMIEDVSTDIHILCVQGHPEFLPDIVQKIVDAREANGVMSAEVAKDARIRAVQQDDGIDVIAKVIWRMFSKSVSL